MAQDKSNPFILEQLEEALEERQTPDRRKSDSGFEGHANEERRKLDRRTSAKSGH